MTLYTIWHYAVWKTGMFLEPACMTTRIQAKVRVPGSHGITINRGHVTCTDCLRMMGPE